MVETVVRHSGGKPQVRKVNGRWSKAVRAKFLGHLAVSCNVAASCRKAGVSDTAAYRLRQTDAGFRADWAAAIAEAVERLEMMLLERAMKGSVTERKTKDGATVKTVAYPDQTALALIRAHKDKAAALQMPEDEEALKALRTKIARKLDMVARREAAKAADDAVGNAAGDTEDKRLIGPLKTEDAGAGGGGGAGRDAEA